VGDEAESVCSWVAAAERLLYETLASVHQNILRPIRVSVKRKNLARIPLASSMLFHPFCGLFLQLLSKGSAGVSALLVEVTRAWEAATTAEAAHAVETSAWMAAAA
jgi:hypothetical protein